MTGTVHRCYRCSVLQAPGARPSSRFRCIPHCHVLTTRFGTRPSHRPFPSFSKSLNSCKKETLAVEKLCLAVLEKTHKLQHDYSQGFFQTLAKNCVFFS